MFTALCLILIAWVVEMPLWLSIVVTILSGVTIFVKLGNVVTEALKNWLANQVNYDE